MNIAAQQLVYISAKDFYPQWIEANKLFGKTMGSNQPDRRAPVGFGAVRACIRGTAQTPETAQLLGWLETAQDADPAACPSACV